MIGRLRSILEMIKFSHTLFAMPFALLAAGMATRMEVVEGRRSRLLDWFGIVLCMVFARSAAMAVNRLVDRRIDAMNPRTANRHLPLGLLTPASVACFAVGCSVGFVAATALFVASNDNYLPVVLAVPVLITICGYSWAKRFTALSHFWLGGSLMAAPVAAWLAIRGAVEWPAVVLGGSVLFWVAGFDIIYACQDFAFDRKAGLRSVPARVGIGPALRIASASHVLTVALLCTLPVTFELSWIYWLGVASIASLLCYEHCLVRPDDLTRVNVAFFQMNIAVSIGLLAATVLDMWLLGA